MSGRDVPLGSVIELRNEIVHPRDLPRGAGRFVGLEHIEPHTGKRTGDAAIRLEELTGRKARFRAGDIVYGYLRPYLNKVWLADFDGYCSVDQYVFKVDTLRAEPAYVAHFMRSPRYLTEAPIDTTPGYLPRIRTEEVLAVRIPLPSLLVQRVIASALSEQLAASDTIRVASGRRLLLAGSLRTNILQSAFDQVTAPRVRIAELVDRAESVDPASSPSQLFSYIDISSVDNRSKRIAEPIRMAGKDAPSRARKRVRLNDVLVATTRPNLNAVAIVTPDLDDQVCSTGFTVLRAKDPVEPDYLFLFVQSQGFVRSLAALVQGALYPAVTDHDVLSQVIPLPNRPEQRRIATALHDRLALIDAIRASTEVEVAAGSALSAALLGRAFPAGGVAE